MSTWHDRLKNAIGDRGYHSSMRRSLQTVILYEAKRAIEPRLRSLRPYQRKAAFMEQCSFLLESLDFVFANQKQEIMWRTMTSRVPLDGTVAWTRLKSINKELKTLSELAKPFIAHGRSHNEVVDLLVQSLFESNPASKGKPVPWTYEYAHNHCILAYRLYYDGDKLDPKFPAPTLCANMSIPTDPPKRRGRSLKGAGVDTVGIAPGGMPAKTGVVATVASVDEADEHAIDMAAILGGGTDKPAEDRRQLLQEVRQHLDILKEFEGVISEEEIARRKRELFQSLPPAPNPATPAPPVAKKVKL